MGELVGNLRLGIRQLWRQPAFALAAVGSLALGIGLNTTLFSIVNGVLLRGSALAAPEQLVEIYSGLDQDFPQLTTSYPDYLDIRAGADALAGVAASAYVRGILSTGGRGELVTGEAVTANYFDLLGVAPPTGRGFREDESQTPGHAAVAVLGHGLWQRRFGGRADIVGENIRLSGEAYTIIGVAPSGFTGTIPGIATDFWVPVMMVDRLEFSGVQMATDENPGATRLDRRGHRWLFVKGRLAKGRTVQDARAQIDTIYRRLASEYLATNEHVTASVVPAADVRFHPMLDGYIRAAGAVLLAAVGLVLLVACANVANMLLARGAARQRELAIRAAIGASRARIVRQLLSETLVLATFGGGLGLVIAWWAGNALSGVGSNVFPMPIRFDFSTDYTVLGFASAVSITTAALCGLLPAWSASTPALVPALKDAVEGERRRRGFAIGDALVVAQLALSLVLLVSGALLARGLLVARNTDIGFDPASITSLSFNLTMNGYDVDRATALRDRAFEALAALPGVTAVSMASRLPLAPDIMLDGVLVPGHHPPDSEGTPTDTVAIGADYFQAVGVPLVAGRPFTREEIAEHRRVAIVNETMARQYWPDGTAVGRLLHLTGFKSVPYQVVGVARDHAVRAVSEAPRPYLHVPFGPSASLGLIVRTGIPAASALPMLRDTLWRLEPDIVFTEDVPAEQIVATTMAPTRIGAACFGAFGLLATLLAAVGVYGVIAYSVSRRTREIGIRLALGAERGQVLRMVLAHGGRLAFVGVTLGAFASAGAGQLLGSLLYGVSGFDGAAYLAASALLLLIALAANLVPALTAARIDPVRALRSE